MITLDPSPSPLQRRVIAATLDAEVNARDLTRTIGSHPSVVNNAVMACVNYSWIVVTGGKRGSRTNPLRYRSTDAGREALRLGMDEENGPGRVHSNADAGDVLADVARFWADWLEGSKVSSASRQAWNRYIAGTRADAALRAKGQPMVMHAAPESGTKFRPGHYQKSAAERAAEARRLWLMAATELGGVELTSVGLAKLTGRGKNGAHYAIDRLRRDGLLRMDAAATGGYQARHARYSLTDAGWAAARELEGVTA